MKQAPEFFGEGEDVELALVYIAKRLKEALQVEEAFNAAGLDYLVEPDKYRGGIIFQTERIGAFFYVVPGKEEEAGRVLAAGGYKPFVKN